jgi:hypothetical protein
VEFRVNLGYPELLQELADGLIGKWTGGLYADSPQIVGTVHQRTWVGVFTGTGSSVREFYADTASLGAVLAVLFRPSSPASVSQLPCTGCHAPAVVFWSSCPGWAVLSRLF